MTLVVSPLIALMKDQGEGRVRTASMERVEVEFADGSAKQFLTEYVRPAR